MMRKAFVASTLFVAVFAFGPSHQVHAGSAVPTTSAPVVTAAAEQAQPAAAPASAPVVTAAAEQPQSAQLKATVVSSPNLQSDSNATTAVEVPAAMAKQERGIFKLREGTAAGCAAPFAGKLEMSPVGRELSAAGKISPPPTIFTAPKIRTADCTCNQGDVCCCGDGWTCCNYDHRCCCWTIVQAE